jgi:ubiquinone/menaquinone biosynthesis C-methylase UbiE
MDKSLLAARTYGIIAEKYAKEFFSDTSDLATMEHFAGMLPKNAKLLDAGCGPGMWTEFFSGKGFHSEGIDLSEGMITLAKKLVPDGKFQVMDMRKLKFENASFDAVCAAYSLCHIETKDVPAVLSEFARVLSKGGLLLLLLQEGRGEEIMPEPFDTKQKMFFKYFKIGEAKELLAKAGFKVLLEAERKSASQAELNRNKLMLIAKKS